MAGFSIWLGVVAVEDEDAADSGMCSSRLERRNLRIKINPLSMSDDDFYKNFRLNKEAFNYIVDQCSSEMTSDRVDVKLAAALRFLAEGSHQHGVGKDYHVALAQSTYSKTLSAMLKVLEKVLCPTWISLEMNPDETIEAKRYFYRKTTIPNVVMCIDGTHLRIIQPRNSPHLYYNRKGYYSLNVLLICDHRQVIRFVDASFQGANHDSHIWRMSQARQYFALKHRSGEDDVRLLGDGGYPAEPWLITPYRAAEAGSEESRFNKRHSEGRMIIERTIGVLKNRFRCTLGARQLHYAPDKAAQIVNVCCALHNICIYFNAPED